MLLSLLLFALQEPAPQEPAPEVPLQEDPVTIEEIQEKLGQVTESFAEADRLLNKTVEELTSGEASPAAEAETGDEVSESLLDQATATSQRLVDEMEELLALLPEPPQSSGGGQGQQSNPQQGQKDPSDLENPEEKELADGNQQGNRPHSSMPQEGMGQAQSLLDSPLRDYLRDPRDGQWGKLPPRLQQAIDNASTEEVPLRYRRWLVEYHRQDVRPSKD